MRNVILQGDCLDIMSSIPEKSVDMVLCDLPYGTTNCKWDSVIPLLDIYKGLNKEQFLVSCFKSGGSYKEAIEEFESNKVLGLWSHYNRVVKDNGAILLFAQTPFDKVLGESNLTMLRYEWIWEKTQATGHLNAKKMPMKAHENILVFYKKLPTYNFIKTTGHVRKVASKKNRDAAIERTNSKESYLYNKQDTTNNKGYDSTERYPRSVQEFSSDKQKSTLHPTQKPIELCRYFIKTYSNPGDLVLDNTAGSGTTGEACVLEGRDYILIEKDPEIYKVCKNRVV